MKPVWKWIIGIVAVLLVATVVGAWYLGHHWKPVLEKQLKAAIVRSTDSLYLISYDEIDFNLITGHAAIENLRLTVDTNRYRQLEEAQVAPDNRYRIRIADLQIRRFHPRRILAEQRLYIDDIVIDTPSIEVVNRYHAYNDTVKTPKEEHTLYQRISGILRGVGVSRLALNGVQFKLTKETDSAQQVTELRDLDVLVSDILIDSLSQFDTTRFYHTRAIDIDMPGFRYQTPDSLYDVSFDHLQVATQAGRLTLSGLEYAPRMNKTEYFKRRQEAKDMVAVAFPTIRLEDIDLQQLVHQRKFHAGSLHIDSGTVAVSNDLRYPKKPENKIGKSPHQQLLRLKPSVTIDSVLLGNIAISYAEVGRKYGREGKITFDRTSAVFRNVTNDPLALLRDRMLVADVTTHIMNTGKLDVRFTFDMLDKEGGHTYTGVLGPMDGRPLNRIITPLLNAEVASANIKGLRFDVKATDRRARGTLHFDYDNMRLNVLANEEDGKPASKRVLSFLANTFIINDSNPDANGQYHTGHINFVRPESYSFFKTLWQSLLQGVKACAGISPEREQRLLNAAEDAKKASERTGGFFRRVFGKKER